MSKSILALDIGEKRCGVAVNSVADLVLELSTIHFRDMADLIEQIGLLIDEYRVQQIVIGQARKGSSLEKFLPNLKSKLKGVKFYLLDETLSTKEAERQLQVEGIDGDSDARAAKILLQQYLERI